MIVKLRTIDEGWAYFPVGLKGVKCRKLTQDQWKFVWSMKDEYYTEIDFEKDGKTPESQEDRDDVYVINVHDSICIYTNQVAFLINDRGQTIERMT